MEIKQLSNFPILIFILATTSWEVFHNLVTLHAWTVIDPPEDPTLDGVNLVLLAFG